MELFNLKKSLSFITSLRIYESCSYNEFMFGLISVDEDVMQTETQTYVPQTQGASVPVSLCLFMWMCASGLQGTVDMFSF